MTLVLRSGDGHMEHLDPGGVAWAAVRQWLEPWGPERAAARAGTVGRA